MKLLKVYDILLSTSGPQNWWPMDGGFSPKEWEVCIGAILTQNTSWNNVKKALDNLKKENIVSLEKTLGTNEKKIAELIRPSGYYNQKAKKLKGFAEFVKTFGNVNNFLKNIERDQLLKVNGIGPETADSILLYAAGKASFVIDAYTKRIFSRMGMTGKEIGYEELRKFFEQNLPRDSRIYNEYHALIVDLGKKVCKPKPLCEKCPLGRKCKKII
ncbi:MAG: endonuclease III domain-containing protein [Candidatus Aenigmarchaeota archaeon]|nr:endonuclease III domain-containing protein [Candidatus Aenigmarchaeota archaeon]